MFTDWLFSVLIIMELILEVNVVSLTRRDLSCHAQLSINTGMCVCACGMCVRVSTCVSVCVWV